MYMCMTMGVNVSVHYFYPKLIPIAGPGITLDNPTPVRCSRDKMSDEYAFLLGNIHMVSIYLLNLLQYIM